MQAISRGLQAHMSLLSLAGKVALVTGGAQGLAAAFAPPPCDKPPSCPRLHTGDILG